MINVTFTDTNGPILSVMVNSALLIAGKGTCARAEIDRVVNYFDNQRA